MRLVRGAQKESNAADLQEVAVSLEVHNKLKPAVQPDNTPP